MLISADDYYGPHMMQIVVDHMDHIPPLGGFVICYQLPDTVSDFGSVNRGVCHVLDNKLVSIQEHLSISRKEDGVLSDKNGIALPEDTLVTMLSYCLQKDFFDAAEPLFQAFLDAKPGPSDEFFLPTVIDDMMRHR